jgi:hypothetical protein
MKYREYSGELINEDSWLMRDLWDTRVAQGRGLATHPKKLASLGVNRQKLYSREYAHQMEEPDTLINKKFITRTNRYQMNNDK